MAVGLEECSVSNQGVHTVTDGVRGVRPARLPLPQSSTTRSKCLKEIPCRATASRIGVLSPDGNGGRPCINVSANLVRDRVDIAPDEAVVDEPIAPAVAPVLLGEAISQPPPLISGERKIDRQCSTTRSASERGIRGQADGF